MEESKVSPLVRSAVYDAKMMISVELGTTSKMVKEVFAMGEGTIIELDRLAGEPLDVKANGVLVAKGETVVIDENFGIRITEIIRESDNFEDFKLSEQSEPKAETPEEST